VDYTEQKKLAAAVNKIGANINSSHLILLLPGVLEENADFRTENAPAIHSSSGAFLFAVFDFYRLLTAFACSVSLLVICCTPLNAQSGCSGDDGNTQPLPCRKITANSA
jgi:hypothetical protein